MHKIVKRILKVTGGLIAILFVLLGVAAVTFSNKSVQKKLLDKATEALQEKLKTHVGIDSISINALTQDITLYGIEIEDREQRKMLTVEKIAIDLKLMSLLQRKIVIERAELIGAKALLLKPSKEEPANYQFIIDAFKKPKGQSKKPKSQMDLDISVLSLKDIRVRHNELDIYLKEASYNKGWISHQTIEADSITLVNDTTSKAGQKSYSVSMGHLTVEKNHGCYSATVKQAHYKNDNHLPRKNTGRPKRGFFDANHLDVTADFHVELDSISKERITGQLNEFQAKDSVTGIDIRKLHTKFDYAKDRIRLNDVVVQQKSTVLNVSSGEIVLPNKEEGRELSYSTGVITGTAYLKDISRIFAPVLKNFSLPLHLSLTMKGTRNAIRFRNVKVNTNDNKLQLAATGDIKNLKDKHHRIVKFDVSSMKAKTGVAEKIIHQFSVKKMMMKQLHNLGNISYQGGFSVVWKKEIFSGLLKTSAGNIDFQFALDELNKYINGKASTRSLELGKVMNMKNLGPVSASANFTIDISKVRTAQMRKQKGGKLPIGFFNATVDDSKYMGIHIRNLAVALNSDGAIATGDVFQYGKHRDLYFSFSFTDTDEMHKLKITKPGIRFHKKQQEQKEVNDSVGQKKGFFKKLFSRKKKTETT